MGLEGSSQREARSTSIALMQDCKSGTSMAHEKYTVLSSMFALPEAKASVTRPSAVCATGAGSRWKLPRCRRAASAGERALHGKSTRAPPQPPAAQARPRPAAAAPPSAAHPACSAPALRRRGRTQRAGLVSLPASRWRRQAGPASRHPTPAALPCFQPSSEGSPRLPRARMRGPRRPPTPHPQPTPHTNVIHQLLGRLLRLPPAAPRLWPEHHLHSRELRGRAVGQAARQAGGLGTRAMHLGGAAYSEGAPGRSPGTGRHTLPLQLFLWARPALRQPTDHTLARDAMHRRRQRHLTARPSPGSHTRPWASVENTTLSASSSLRPPLPPPVSRSSRRPAAPAALLLPLPPLSLPEGASSQSRRRTGICR